MKQRSLISSLVAVPFVALMGTACVQGSENNGAASDPVVVQKDQTCSGTGRGAQCAPGLTCALYDTPDAGGVCIDRHDATDGAVADGAARTDSAADGGFAGDSAADGGFAGEGEFCSGTKTGMQCEPDLSCGLYDMPGAGGVCIKL